MTVRGMARVAPTPRVPMTAAVWPRVQCAAMFRLTPVRCDVGHAS